MEAFVRQIAQASSGGSSNITIDLDRIFTGYRARDKDDQDLYDDLNSNGPLVYMSFPTGTRDEHLEVGPFEVTWDILIAKNKNETFNALDIVDLCADIMDKITLDRSVYTSGSMVPNAVRIDGAEYEQLQTQGIFRVTMAAEFLDPPLNDETKEQKTEDVKKIWEKWWKRKNAKRN